MQTVVSTMPVNYRDSAGSWQPIDDSLVKQPDGGYRNAADDFSVAIPARSSSPVVSSKGTLSVSSQLVGGADVPVVADGAQATYSAVLPGVDAVFDIRPDTVEETLRLVDQQVPRSYTWTVTVPDGVSLQLAADRSVSLVDVTGTVVGSLPAPVLRDSSTDPDTNTSTAAHYTLTGTAPRYSVTVSIDGDWFDDPARVFPVSLDPSTTFGTSADLGCYVASSGAPDPSVCATNTGTDNPLSYGSTAYVRHAYLNFGDLTATGSAVPPDAVISDAVLSLTESGASSPTAALATSIYRPAAAWSSTITYSTQPVNSGTQFDNVSVVPPGVGNVASFHIPGLATAWVQGGVPNYGLELKLTTDAVSNTLTFYGLANAAHHPTLTVTWQQPVGQQPWVGAYDHRLSDRLDLHVDLGDRNLVVNDLAEQLSGPGQSLLVRHTYNSLVAVSGTAGGYGPGWLMNGGVDTGLLINRTAVTFNEPGGAQEVFTRNFTITDLTQTAAFNPPPGANAQLSMPDSTHYTLKFNQSQQVDTFTLPTAGAATGWLSSVADSNGNTISCTASGSPLVTTAISDTTGVRSVSMTYTSGKVTGMTENLASGTPRSWSYNYDGSGRLSTYTDAAGKVTRYCYSGSTNLLTKLITPRGTASGATCSTTAGIDVTDIGYDTGGHVTSVSYENSASAAITVTFATQTALAAGGTGVTRLTDPYSQHTDYTYDTSDRVIMTVDPLGNTRTSTFTTNNDVTASVTPNNYSGGGSDPTTTTLYKPTTNVPSSVTLPTGAMVSAGYPSTGQVYLPTSVTDDLGIGPSHQTGIGYNSYGQPTSVAKGAATLTTIHDGEGSPAVHCGPSGAAAYPGAVCETQDADYSPSVSSIEHRTLYSYDSLGELVSVTPAQPGTSVTRSNITATYDGQSRIASSTSSKGDVTGFHYDALDRLIKIDVPGHGPAEFVYDEDGNLQSNTDYDASHVAQNYDNYTYDPLNRLATKQNWTAGTATLSWDGNSHLLSYNDPGGTVSYGYDAAGGLTSLTEPGGSCSGFSLNPAARVPPTSGSGCTLFRLDKSGGRLETVHPGDVADQTYVYDNSGRPTRITGYTVGDGGGATKTFDYSYGYTVGTTPPVDTDHITQRTDSITGNVVNYSYSTEARLASAVTQTSGGTTIASSTYCYDKNGNLSLASTTIGASCTSQPYTSDGANQISGSPAGAATYDDDGNETQADSTATGTNQSRTTGYTRGNQVLNFNVGGAGALAQLHFGVDNNERFTSAISSTDSQAILTSPLGISATTRSHSGTPQNPKYYTRDPDGNLIGMRLGSTDYYYQTDNQQSVLRLLDASGTVKDSYSYDPYGVQTASATVVQPFGYASGYLDDFSGLVKFGARYYDPTQARFTQPDPMTHVGDVNQSSPYPYAGDDPVNNGDPTGELSIGQKIGIGLFVGVSWWRPSLRSDSPALAA